MVDKFGWRGTRTTLLAVHHDEIRRNAGFEHRLDDGEEFVRVADTSLKPAGLQPESVRSSKMNSISASGVEKAEWAAGDMQSLPMGMPRVSEISSVIFAAGKTPPWPGLAPWLSSISIILTWSRVAVLTKFSGEKVPSSLRQPK